MRTLLIIALAAAGPFLPAPQYFSNVRDVHVSALGRQNYFTVDAELWEHARPDLGDLRLYASGKEVPYALVTERGVRHTREHPGKILNLGVGKGATEFVVDTGGTGEYNRVTLRLEAQNFISRAAVYGLNELRGGSALHLGTFTVYNLAREQLGANTTLKLPDSSFRYLRVTLPGVAPEHVRGATVEHLEETKTAWVEVAAEPRITQSGKATVVTWDSPHNVPLDRIVFDVRPDQVNFRRAAAVWHPDGYELTHGQLSRVHLQRDGRLVEAEDLTLNVPETHAASFRVVIENGDDPPLGITAVHPLSVERRVYFDPSGRPSLRLYYGDPALNAPTYDYAKLFARDAQAAFAELGPGAHNSVFTGRPDTRPWTERHAAVLWIVLVLAILTLGAIAVRSLRGFPPSHSGPNSQPQ